MVILVAIDRIGLSGRVPPIMLQIFTSVVRTRSTYGVVFRF